MPKVTKNCWRVTYQDKGVEKQFQVISTSIIAVLYTPITLQNSKKPMVVEDLAITSIVLVGRAEVIPETRK